MSETKKTLRQLIAELTSEGNVPESFKQSAIALLQQKGISLDADCAPWAEILTRSFRCRAETQRICDSLITQLKEVTLEIDRLRERCLKVAEQARAREERMREIAAALRASRREEQEQKKEPSRFLVLLPKLLPN